MGPNKSLPSESRRPTYTLEKRRSRKTTRMACREIVEVPKATPLAVNSMRSLLSIIVSGTALDQAQSSEPYGAASATVRIP
jgi:hypothetical protein